MKKVLVIDHKDSFTQNVVAELESLGAKTLVLGAMMARPLPTQAILQELRNCDALVLSPGPGHPRDYLYGDLPRLLASQFAALPIFGICLGMQLLLHWDGFPIEALFEIERQSSNGAVVHGRVESVSDGHVPLPHPFDQLDPNSPVAFYNSLGLNIQKCSAGHEWHFVLDSAQRASVNIACHRVRPHFGVQFHPESFASPKGSEFFRAFMNLVEGQSCYA